MSQPNWNALQAKMQGPTQRLHYIKNSTGSNLANPGSVLMSSWIDAGNPAAGSAPTTASVCTSATTGALGQFNKFGTDQRAWLERFDIIYTNVCAPGFILLVDRLVHVGGFDGTNITAQSNGAWPALTRFTSGVGVWAAFEIYTAIGATVTTATISYTNTVPTSGQTSVATAIGGTGSNSVRRILPVSIASGDTGITSVASATLAATTGTVGNWGVTLFKTLGMWSTSTSGNPVSHNGRVLPYFGGVPSIPDNACLQFLFAVGNAGVSIGATVNTFEN